MVFNAMLPTCEVYAVIVMPCGFKTSFATAPATTQPAVARAELRPPPDNHGCRIFADTYSLHATDDIHPLNGRNPCFSDFVPNDKGNRVP